MSGNVRLTDVVKSRLEQYKDEKGHSNYDSAVREIMIKADIDIYEGQEEETDNEGGSITDEWG